MKVAANEFDKIKKKKQKQSRMTVRHLVCPTGRMRLPLNTIEKNTGAKEMKRHERKVPCVYVKQETPVTHSSRDVPWTAGCTHLEIRYTYGLKV